MIEKIKKYNLCIGCGLCESVLGKKRCEMKLNEQGFYVPELKDNITQQETKIIRQLCPGIHVEAKSHDGVWGTVQSISEAWAADKEARHKAASGGVITSLAIYLLESHEVDAVMQIGVREDSYLYNELQISRTKADILKNAQSRYAPSLFFHHIIEIFDSCNDTFAFVGKPCDIAAMQNFIREFPLYDGRVKFYLSIFCAGMPSYNATIKLWKQSGHEDAPLKLKYRGDGWPGNFRADFADGSNYQVTYNESWGTVLNRYLCFRCKICPDGIGMLADVAVGDSWETKDGYPDFTENEGKSFCMVRTNIGVRLMKNAEKAGYIVNEQVDIEKIQEKQAYQYERRKLEGWRLLPVQLLTGGILNFKGLDIWQQAKTASIKAGFINMIGTLKRFRVFI